MRKSIIASLMVVMIAAALTGPASAAKKKKLPKPYKSEEVTIQIGHSTLYATSGEMVSITGREFMHTCALPQSNGLDGYVFEVPEAYRNIDSSIQAFGAPGSVAHDLDIFLFAEDCSVTQYFGTDAADEAGVLSPGTAYIMLQNFGGSGAPIGGGDAVTASFELKPLK